MCKKIGLFLKISKLLPDYMTGVWGVFYPVFNSESPRFRICVYGKREPGCGELGREAVKAVLRGPSRVRPVP